MTSTTRKRKPLLTAAAMISGLLLFSAMTRADERLDTATAACKSVDDCLNVLYDWSRDYNGRIEDVSVAIVNLKRFGEPMRRALLDKATGKDAQLIELSDLLLSAWHDWTPGDVAALAQVLSHRPGGMVARSLGEVGTPEAIEALVADVRRMQGQSEYALQLLGPRAVPYLFPLLEDAQTARAAVRVLKAMTLGDASRTFARSWAQLAADPTQPTEVRLGALRGLAALGQPARQWTGDLHTLLASQDESVKTTATRTLLELGDPVVQDSLLDRCHPNGDELEFLAMSSTQCLRDIQSLGHDAREAGPKLTPFLDSPNADERLGAVTALGIIGYAGATPRLREALKDLDWRVVYAASKSLGQLRAAEASEDLQRITDTYWLPEVRREAMYSLVAFKLPADAPVPWKQSEVELDSSGMPPFVFYTFVLDHMPYCWSEQWHLQSTVFHLPSSPAPRTVSARLKADHGTLYGSNGGEWGGGLTWKPDGGPEKVIYKGYNVIGIFPDRDGAIAVIGVGHMEIDLGIIVSVNLDARGRWTLHEIARLPGASSAMIRISPGVYAARSGRRVTVFNRTGILGLATCMDPRTR